MIFRTLNSTTLIIIANDRKESNSCLKQQQTAASSSSSKGGRTAISKLAVSTLNVKPANFREIGKKNYFILIPSFHPLHSSFIFNFPYPPHPTSRLPPASSFPSYVLPFSLLLPSLFSPQLSPTPQSPFPQPAEKTLPKLPLRRKQMTGPIQVN